MKQSRADLESEKQALSNENFLLYRALAAALAGELTWIYPKREYSGAIFDLDGAAGGCVLLRYVSREVKQKPHYSVHVLDKWYPEAVAHLGRAVHGDRLALNAYELALKLNKIQREHHKTELAKIAVGQASKDNLNEIPVDFNLVEKTEGPWKGEIKRTIVMTPNEAQERNSKLSGSVIMWERA